MNTESITPKSDPCCNQWANYGEHAKSCQVFQALTECYACGEKIEGEVCMFTHVGSEFCSERHRACCPSIVYVNAYRVTLAYGGPQEGGWWYDEGEPLGSIPIRSEDDGEAAYEFAKAYLQDLYKDVQVRTKSSMGGSDLLIRVEEHQAEHFPSRRPHYE